MCSWFITPSPPSTLWGEFPVSFQSSVCPALTCTGHSRNSVALVWCKFMPNSQNELSALLVRRCPAGALSGPAATSNRLQLLNRPDLVPRHPVQLSADGPRRHQLHPHVLHGRGDQPCVQHLLHLKVRPTGRREPAGTAVCGYMLAGSNVLQRRCGMASVVERMGLAYGISDHGFCTFSHGFSHGL